MVISMKSTNNNYRFIDLFAGIGGFRLALESRGMTCVFSSEWDARAQKTYKENYGENPEGDITKINERDIPKHDILCAGFPCQAFSISGKQKGFQDTRGTLFFDIARIAQYHQPKVLFLENVKNLETHNNGKTIKTILTTLEQIGYETYYSVLNASLYGAPTARERLYFICFNKSLKIKEFIFPNPSFDQVNIRNHIFSDNISDLIINRKDIKLYNKIIEPDMYGSYPLKPIRIGIINKGGQGERIYSDLGHAITFSAYGGGAGAKTGAYLINGIVRKLSPQECLSIMGYSPDYILPVNRTQAYQQIGNSVVVTVLKKIVDSFIKKME